MCSTDLNLIMKIGKVILEYEFIDGDNYLCVIEGKIYLDLLYVMLDDVVIIRINPYQVMIYYENWQIY